MSSGTAGIPDRLPVLVAAAGEPWEAAALDRITRDGPGLVLHKRCLDLPDLLASGRTGMAVLAVVAAGLPGLDADSVSALRRDGVATVLVGTGDRSRWARLGIDHFVDPEHLEVLDSTLRAATVRLDEALTVAEVPGDADQPTGDLLVVWGPAGAPGRTTMAVNLAAELVALGRAPFLLDADPYGGAVGQHLGVLDEVSGLLAAARTANAGELNPTSLADLARSVDGIRVLTGLPRPDRWNEVRLAAYHAVLEEAAHLSACVVVDVGFSLERDQDDPFGGRPGRNAMTLSALERADQIIVVGSADPVGLARLARGLVELRTVVSSTPVRVVLNRTRPSLGWAERDLREMVEGFVRPLSMHFLPDDRQGTDRALMGGRPLWAGGESSLRREIAALAGAVTGQTHGTRRAPLTRRRSRRG